MTLTRIEPRHSLDDYIGMDAVTHMNADNKEVHTVVLAWIGGQPNYVGSGQESHGPYPTRVEAIAAAREFGRTINAHRKLLGLPEKQWRYR